MPRQVRRPLGLANLVIGNNLSNTLASAAGVGTLLGQNGNDSLNGGAGSDSMAGGLGSDRYTVDETGDQIMELPGEGNDSVIASVGWTLGANLEGLVLTGSADLHGTGNALANRITGSGGGNLLAGFDGRDVLLGQAGADTLVGGNDGDVLTGGTGADWFLLPHAALRGHAARIHLARRDGAELLRRHGVAPITSPG